MGDDGLAAPERAVSGGGLPAALLRAQQKFPPILKNRQVRAGAKNYEYIDLHDILAVVQPVLNEEGILLTQPFEVGDDGRTVVLTTVLTHVATGETMVARTPMTQGTEPPQGFGSAVTYVRRYSLIALLSIQPASEDDDALSLTPPPPPPPPRRNASPARGAAPGAYTSQPRQSQQQPRGPENGPPAKVATLPPPPTTHDDRSDTRGVPSFMLDGQRLPALQWLVLAEKKLLDMDLADIGRYWDGLIETRRRMHTTTSDPEIHRRLSQLSLWVKQSRPDRDGGGEPG